MHEWALAEAVIETVLKYISNTEGDIEACIEVGELQQIDLNIFKYALDKLKEERNIPNIHFRIVIIKALLKCRRCSFEWTLDDIKESLNVEELEAVHFIPELIHALLKCPRCNSMDFDIVEGRGVRIGYLKTVGGDSGSQTSTNREENEHY